MPVCDQVVPKWVLCGSPRLAPPGVGVTHWAWLAFPTLQLFTAPSLQFTPQGQGLATLAWPLGTGPRQTHLLHGGPALGLTAALLPASQSPPREQPGQP